MNLANDDDAAPTQSKLRHDLLNAINVLVGATAGIRTENLTEAQQRWMSMLESATARLAGLANTMAGDDRRRCRRRPARDSRTCARLPRRASASRSIGSVSSTRSMLLAGGKARRILLVDDSPELVSVVRAYLDGTPWTLDDVESGEGAVARAAAEHYDVVLMDIDLPGLDGTAAAHAIRAADLARGASPTPIIAMTAFDPEPSRPATGGEKGDRPFVR